MQKPTLKALDYAVAARHESIEAVHVNIAEEASEKLSKLWDEMNIRVPLRIVPSPYRDISTPLITYLKARRAEFGSEVITVYTPQYIVGHWRENLLHNHKARSIRPKLMLVHGVTIALAPGLIEAAVCPRLPPSPRVGSAWRAAASGNAETTSSRSATRSEETAEGTSETKDSPSGQNPSSATDMTVGSIPSTFE